MVAVVSRWRSSETGECALHTNSAALALGVMTSAAPHRVAATWPNPNPSAAHKTDRAGGAAFYTPTLYNGRPLHISGHWIVRYNIY
jgi:hypothetical protein